MIRLKEMKNMIKDIEEADNEEFKEEYSARLIRTHGKHLIKLAERVEILEQENNFIKRTHRINTKVAECALNEKRQYKQALETLSENVDRQGKYGGWIPKEVSYKIQIQIDKALREGEQ